MRAAVIESDTVIADSQCAQSRLNREFEGGRQENLPWFCVLCAYGSYPFGGEENLTQCQMSSLPQINKDHQFRLEQ
jgi:hypothetical protein